MCDYVRLGDALCPAVPVRSAVTSRRQCNAMHPNAGSVRPTSDVTARKPRYYGRFNQLVLWRDVMCEKTSGNLGFSEPEGRRNRRSVVRPERKVMAM